MATRDQVNRVVEHLLLYWSSGFTSKMNTANTERLAELIGGEKENFTLSGHTLGISVEGTDNTVTLTDGTRTAANVATDINTAAIGVTASADGQGRTKIVSDTAATATQPSMLTIIEPSSGTDASSILGFRIGQEDQRTLLAKPTFVYRLEPHSGADYPIVEVEDGVRWVKGSIRSEIHEVFVPFRVLVTDAHGSEVAAGEACDRIASILEDILDDDPDCEDQFIVAKIERLQTNARVYGRSPPVAETRGVVYVRTYQF